MNTNDVFNIGEDQKLTFSNYSLSLSLSLSSYREQATETTRKRYNQTFYKQKSHFDCKEYNISSVSQLTLWMGVIYLLL